MILVCNKMSVEKTVPRQNQNHLKKKKRLALNSQIQNRTNQINGRHHSASVIKEERITYLTAQINSVILHANDSLAIIES